MDNKPQVTIDREIKNGNWMGQAGEKRRDLRFSIQANNFIMCYEIVYGRQY